MDSLQKTSVGLSLHDNYFFKLTLIYDAKKGFMARHFDISRWQSERMPHTLQPGNSSEPSWLTENDQNILSVKGFLDRISVSFTAIFVQNKLGSLSVS